MFSVEIKTMPVTNQKATGRCWLFAGLNLMREDIARQFKLEEFELSQNYLAFWDKFEKANLFSNRSWIRWTSLRTGAWSAG